MKPFLRKGRKYLHVKVRLANGKWSRPIATEFEPGQEAEAAAVRDQMQAKIAAGFDPGGPLTVRSYYARWIETRDNASKRDDVTRMTLHVLPELGHLPMDDVRPRHVRDLIRKLRKSRAARTVHNVYAVMASMFRDAVVDEVIRATPCVLKRGDLPKKRDKDPEWRAGAVFTRAEVETIISDERIPSDRRTFYALLFMTSSRFGEVSALRWRHYDPSLKPLGRIVVASSYNTKLKKVTETKTETPRSVPVHKALAAILAEWKLGGFVEQFGHEPRPDDLMVPSRRSKNRSVNHMLRHFHDDLETLKLRSRRMHDTKRTFRSIALDDGANEARLSWITHGRKSSVEGSYDEPSWAALCECVQVMRIQRKNAAVARFGANGATSVEGDGRTTEQGRGL